MCRSESYGDCDLLMVALYGRLVSIERRCWVYRHVRYVECTLVACASVSAHAMRKSRIRDGITYQSGRIYLGRRKWQEQHVAQDKHNQEEGIVENQGSRGPFRERRLPLFLASNAPAEEHDPCRDSHSDVYSGRQPQQYPYHTRRFGLVTRRIGYGHVSVIRAGG
jgi:hypothetical protein